MGAHRLIIGCNFKQYATQGGNFTPNRYLLLDTVDEKGSEGSSTIATQPMQSGDTISDHMYRMPDTYHVSGNFSLNGINWNDNSYDFIKVGDRLTNIQETFKKIKDECLLCTLITIDSDILPAYTNKSSKRGGINTEQINRIANGIESGLRFSIHKNMALTRITWTELENSVKYNFQFQQVIMVEQPEYEELSLAEKRSLGLPSVTSPVGSSLGTVLANSGNLAETIYKTLYDNGYIEDDFTYGMIEILKEKGMVVLASAIFTTAAAIGAIILTVAMGALASSLGIVASVSAGVAAVFPVGTIIAAAVVFTACVVGGLVALFKHREKEYKKRMAFKLIKNDATHDTLRFLNLVDDIQLEIDKVQNNVTIYEIKENKPHQVILNIAGNYYAINFIEDNANGYGWNAQVKMLDGSTPSTINKDKWCPVSNFADMNRNLNMWFKDETKQYEVYLMNPALSDNYNSKDEEIETVRKKLTSYTIWVSYGDIQNNINTVSNAIENAIVNEGFK